MAKHPGGTAVGKSFAKVAQTPLRKAIAACACSIVKQLLWNK